MPIDEAFWRNEEDELFNVLFPLMRDAALNGAKNGAIGAAIGVDWALVNKAAVDWAREHTLGLVRDITDTSKDFVRQEISAWVESGQPLTKLITALEPMFGDLRAEMIAVTEVTRAYAEGNSAAWQAGGIVKQVRWQTAEDDLVCPVCGPLADKVFDLNTTKPPAHPNCRCWLTPVV